ncbi:hypothetical protein [Marseilla massiliensis]|uniref:Uncharacterized protein n=1 Tax=Marseilla massiliensis TaxID=1841864 RepID=A0A939B5S8_9BACT|nr:hypothetical protein [Marseilla massiliensis]MBM6673704.1 hypothetical protein [Marseilla massiliensis]
MSNFDIKRFAKVAQWTWRMNFKGALSYAAGMSFGFLCTYIGWIYPYLKGMDAGGEERMVHSISFCTLVYLLIFIISGTWIFADMKTKAACTTVKLQPASDLEKFLVRFLGVTLGVAVMGIVSFCIADIVRIVACLITGVDYVTFSLPYFLQMVFTNADITGNLTSAGSTYPTAVNFVAAGWCFWAQSLYILGGTALRRYQFAITSTVHAALFIAMTVVVAYGNGNIEATVMDEGLAPTFYTIGAVLFGIAVLNWWFSYRIFKRMQVINNKWINL